MIRQLKAQDIPELKDMLQKENIILEETELLPINTYIWDDDIKGFFHFRIEQNVPSLRHFCIKKDYRNFKNAMMLIKEYLKIIYNFKYSLITIEKPYLKKLIEYKFKKKPYFQEDNVIGYLVEVI